jgi:class 3 adenylate cyclase/predicted ATPase
LGSFERSSSAEDAGSDSCYKSNCISRGSRLRCSSCNSENPDSKRFCGDCGAPLANLCPACGAENLRSNKFCGDCGAPFARTPTPPATASATSNQFEISASRADTSGERRHLTVLFCDLVGSTAIAAQLDPEEWRTIVADYHRSAADAVGRFGGYVAQYLGDGIMAYFGWPEAHDNEAERAVRAGLAILGAIVKLNEEPGRPRLSGRVGIDSGAGVVGASAAKGADVFGDAPNIAARVQAAAEPDTVVITGATRRLVSGLFVVEERGTHALKGIDRPVNLYRVVQPSGVRGRLEAIAASRGLTTFVGRDEELRLLMNRWERVLDGEGQVTLIVGEAGIGKSRLVQRFHEQIGETKHLWAAAAAGAFFQNTPFYQVGDLIKQFLHFDEDNRPEDILIRLERVVERSGLRPAAAIPLIAPLLNLAIPPEYPPLSIPSEQKRRRLLSTLVDWVLGFARLSPVAIVTEDLHWADPSTLELFALLGEQGATARLLLLYTARPEFRAQWSPRAHHTQISLNRLNAQNVRSMIAEVTASKALASATIDAMIERTGGVPLFVEELTHAVIEAGAGAAALAIPATLHDSLMARLDRLGQAKEIAQTAAVIGPEFSYELLNAVHPVGEAELQTSLTKLADAQLLYVNGIPPNATYRFKHALIRDAAYETLLKSKRRDVHRLVAKMIDTEFPVIKEAHPEVLAQHWAEAGEIDQAILSWEKAGRRALEHSANTEAIGHLRKGLGLLKSVTNPLTYARHELSLQIYLGLAQMALKGYAAPEVSAAFTRALELSEENSAAPDLYPALSGLLRSHYVGAELHKARDLGLKWSQLVQRTQDPIFLLETGRLLGSTSFYLGELGDARTHLERSTSIYDPVDHGSMALQYGTDPGVASLCYLSNLLWCLGFPDQALIRSQQSLALASRQAHQVSFAGAWHFASLLHHFRGEVVTARERAEAAISFSTKHGFEFFAALGTIDQGWALIRQSQVAEGMTQIERGMFAYKSIGAQLWWPFFLSLLASAHLTSETAKQGLALISEANDIIDRTAERWWLPELWRLEGELLLKEDSDNEVEAKHRLDQAIVIAKEQQSKSLQLRATISLARLLRDNGGHDEARVMLAEIYNWFTEGFDTTDLLEAKALLDELNN